MAWCAWVADNFAESQIRSLTALRRLRYPGGVPRGSRKKMEVVIRMMLMFKGR